MSYKIISKHNDVFYFEMHGFVCDLDEHSWAVKAALITNAVLGLKELKKKDPAFTSIPSKQYSLFTHTASLLVGGESRHTHSAKCVQLLRQHM